VDRHLHITDKLEYSLFIRKLFYITSARIGHSEFTADMKLASKSSGTSSMYPPANRFRVPKDETDGTDLDFKKFKIKLILRTQTLKQLVGRLLSFKTEAQKTGLLGVLSIRT
jgi:hypothetical protein